MTAQRGHHHGCDLDQLHRDEITVAMNWVIRTCQDIIREHSRRARRGSRPAPCEVLRRAATLRASGFPQYRGMEGHTIGWPVSRMVRQALKPRG
ncbi:hypothetical protein [Streptomyces violaceusniger]|uniref:hypothetical protein n=1 Tax=Streptomyces violaceusniger TaxID=68280 RepID=UPI0009966C6A|nr:hypothetical protein [Streptomyces hygroscopicus]AQW51646.1 hypothetical protein SHXM_05109 [Streptomyces hygroscopicus]